MVMITDLVRVLYVEVLVTFVALDFLIEILGEPSVPLQPLLVVLECGCLLLEG